MAASLAYQAENSDTFDVDLKIGSDSKYYWYTLYGFTRNDGIFSVLRRCLKVSKLISKCPFGVFKSPKTLMNFFKNSFPS